MTVCVVAFAPETLPAFHSGRLTDNYKASLRNTDLVFEKVKTRLNFPVFFQKYGKARPYF